MGTPSIRNVSKALPTVTSKQKDPFLIQRASPPRGWLSRVSPSPASFISQLESRVVVTEGGEGGKESPVPGEQRPPQTSARVSAGVSQARTCSRGLGAGVVPARQLPCPRGQRIDVETQEEKEEEREREEGEDRRSGRKDGGKEGRREGGRKGSLDLN